MSESSYIVKVLSSVFRNNLDKNVFEGGIPYHKTLSVCFYKWRMVFIFVILSSELADYTIRYYKGEI
jgi:hypothetical protein